MALSDDFRAMPRLLGDAMQQLGHLVENEVELAKAELADKINQAKLGAIYLAGAAVLAIPVLVMLLMVLAMWFADLGLSPIAAHLAAAACGAVIALVLAIAGMSYLKADNLKPKATLSEVRQDIATAREIAG